MLSLGCLNGIVSTVDFTHEAFYSRVLLSRISNAMAILQYPVLYPLLCQIFLRMRCLKVKPVAIVFEFCMDFLSNIDKVQAIITPPERIRGSFIVSLWN